LASSSIPTRLSVSGIKNINHCVPSHCTISLSKPVKSPVPTPSTKTLNPLYTPPFLIKPDVIPEGSVALTSDQVCLNLPSIFTWLESHTDIELLVGGSSWVFPDVFAPFDLHCVSLELVQKE